MLIDTRNALTATSPSMARVRGPKRKRKVNVLVAVPGATDGDIVW